LVDNHTQYGCHDCRHESVMMTEPTDIALLNQIADRSHPALATLYHRCGSAARLVMTATLQHG
jgi:hypothetical protein